MPLPHGYSDLPAGELANVVTCLEMFERPDPRPDPPGAAGSIVRIERPDMTWYRSLFRRVGEPYLWSSRLRLTDEQLARIINDPRVEVYPAKKDSEEVGLLELDFRVDGECEIALFGIVGAALGRGIGRWLMNRAIARAWSEPIRRLWLHTCTLDHPAALPFYIRSGFRPYLRQVEIHDDPRVIGLYPRTAAPQVPLL